MRDYERKTLLLPLIKHNLSFSPPHCGVPIAQILQAWPCASAQTLFDMMNMASLVPRLLESPEKARALGHLCFACAAHIALQKDPLAPARRSEGLR